jgi:hypothetical protein
MGSNLRETFVISKRKSSAAGCGHQINSDLAQHREERPMKRTLTAAALVMATIAPAAHAMENEATMLTGALYNGLTRMQIDTANMSNLTLGEVNIIASILHSGDSEGEKRRLIDTIIRKAGER